MLIHATQPAFGRACFPRFGRFLPAWDLQATSPVLFGLPSAGLGSLVDGLRWTAPDPRTMTMNSTPNKAALMTQVSHRAMATEFVVMLPDQHAGAVEAVVTAMDELDEIEAALTIYRPDSEISKANRLAGCQPVRLSRETFSLIEKAILWSRRTEGAFDITAGPLVEAWGFTRRSGRKPTVEEVERALQCVGYQFLVLDSHQSTIEFARAGVSMNMGGIGKGDALDRIAKRLQAAGVTDFLLHGGSSSVVAVGDQTQGSGMGWAVGISHPTKPKRRLGGVWLRNGSLATSGSGKQFFHHRGKRFGHVIDPRTGYPAGDLLALTVVTDSAADADACSTGFFVAGSRWVQELWDSRRQSDRQQDPAWKLPAMIAVGPGQRQDETTIETLGEIEWVDEENELSGGVSRSGEGD